MRAAVAVAAGLYAGWHASTGKAFAQLPGTAPKKEKIPAGEWLEGAPEFTDEQVAAHGSRDTGVWVTHRSGVYDVSEFVDAHPGGAKRLLLAAGGPVTGFWKQLTIHDKDEVRRILETYRIGNLSGTREKDFADEEKQLEEMAAAVWEGQPRRSAKMEVHSTTPFAGETPLEAQTQAGATPNELHFVRHHFPVPNIDANDFCLNIGGDEVQERCITVDALRKEFRKHSVAVTIQCGGNRRSEAMGIWGVQRVKGIPWGSGGAGTAVWSGAPLHEVLTAAAGGDRARLDEMARSGRFHVHAVGADSDAAVAFEVSIPLAMAMDPDREVTVAWEMNGEPIPRDHGYPLRLVVPGVVGVRNCKWLSELSIRDYESQGDWTKNNYKMYPPWMTKPGPGVDAAFDTSVQSVITEVKKTAPNAATVKGWTFCGGGRGVQRVELSTDAGRSFSSAARIDPGFNQAPGRKWAWQAWSADVTLPTAPEGQKTVVCSRAISSTNDVQPNVPEYNFRGLFFNGYSCKEVHN